MKFYLLCIIMCFICCYNIVIDIIASIYNFVIRLSDLSYYVFVIHCQIDVTF